VRVIIDTREKGHKHLIKAFDEKGIEYITRKLEFGDYSFEVDGKSYENKCIIERKQNLSELSGNICQRRNQFETEFSKGMAVDCKMVLLIEDKKAKEKIKLRIAMDAAGVDIETRKRKTWFTRCTGKSMYGKRDII
jgi:ERCC4-type nuclease